MWRHNDTQNAATGLSIADASLWLFLYMNVVIEAVFQY